MNHKYSKLRSSKNHCEDSTELPIPPQPTSREPVVQKARSRCDAAVSWARDVASITTQRTDGHTGPSAPFAGSTSRCRAGAPHGRQGAHRHSASTVAAEETRVLSEDRTGGVGSHQDLRGCADMICCPRKHLCLMPDLGIQTAPCSWKQ